MPMEFIDQEMGFELPVGLNPDGSIAEPSEEIPSSEGKKEPGNVSSKESKHSMSKKKNAKRLSREPDKSEESASDYQDVHIMLPRAQVLILRQIFLIKGVSLSSVVRSLVSDYFENNRDEFEKLILKSIRR